MKHSLEERLILDERASLNEAPEPEQAAASSPEPVSAQVGQLIQDTEEDSVIERGISILSAAKNNADKAEGAFDKASEAFGQITESVREIQALIKDKADLEKAVAYGPKIVEQIKEYANGFLSLLSTDSARLSSAGASLRELIQKANEADRLLSDSSKPAMNASGEDKLAAVQKLLDDFSSLKERDLEFRALNAMAADREARQKLRNDLNDIWGKLSEIPPKMAGLNDELKAGRKNFSGEWWKAEAEDKAASFRRERDSIRDSLKWLEEKYSILALFTERNNEQLTTLPSRIEALSKSIDDLSASIKSWSDDKANYDEAEKRRLNRTNKNSAKKDWDKLFDNATEYGASPDEDPTKMDKSATVTGQDIQKALDAVWDLYFAAEWKGYDTSALNAVLSPFQKELDAYGYTEEDNPFVDFLKVMLKKPGFAQALKSYPAKYSVIHNLVASRVISLPELRGTSELKRTDAVFRPKLYEMTTKMMEEYLVIQATVLRIFAQNAAPFLNRAKVEKGRTTARGEEPGSPDNWLNGKYRRDRIQNFVADLLYVGGDPLSEDPKAAINLTEASLDNAAFKKLSDINYIMTQCFARKTIDDARESLGDRGKKIQLTDKNVDLAFGEFKKKAEGKEVLSKKRIELCKIVIWALWEKNLKDKPSSDRDAVYKKYDIDSKAYASEFKSQIDAYLNGYFERYDVSRLGSDLPLLKKLTDQHIGKWIEALKKANA